MGLLFTIFMLFVFSLIFFNFTIANSMLSPLCYDDEHFALLQFKEASSLMRLIPSIHVVPNQLHGSLKKETLIPAHGMVSSAMKTQVVSSRLTSRVAASRVLSTLAAAFSRLSILSGLIFLLTTSMVLKSHLLTFRVYPIKPLFCCFS